MERTGDRRWHKKQEASWQFIQQHRIIIADGLSQQMGSWAGTHVLTDSRPNARIGAKYGLQVLFVLRGTVPAAVRQSQSALPTSTQVPKSS
ncbi:hypothetical protein HYQ46_009202 [Verticillium longisporum]|nr:hypothetical protein HYQ46_009202 [Verticillium longisporum]